MIVVDAVDMGSAPGTVRRFTADEILGLPESRSFSLHEIGLLEVLKIGRGLKDNFKGLVIFGVQPRNIDQGQELSPEVAAGIPEVARMIKKEVDGHGSDR